MGWAQDLVGTLIVPTGATTGQRIVIDGTTGTITGYDAGNNVIFQLNVDGITVDNTKGSVDIFSGSIPQVNMTLGAEGGITFDGGGWQVQPGSAPDWQPFTAFSSATQDLFNSPEIFMYGTTATGLKSLMQLFSQTWQLLSDTNPGEGAQLSLLSAGGSRLDLYTSSATEPWHALSLQNSWTNRGGSDVTAQYRKVVSPPNTVEIIGYIASGTVTDGTTLFTLPTGYRPAHNCVFPVYSPNVVAGRTALLTVQPSGACTITFLSGATSVGFHCFIPLDA